MMGRNLSAAVLLAAITVAAGAVLDCPEGRFKRRGVHIEEIGRYWTGDVDEGIEIFDVDMKGRRVFYVGGKSGVTILRFSSDFTNFRKIKSFSVGDGLEANSLAWSKRHNLLAVAASSEDEPWGPGFIKFYNRGGVLKGQVEVSSQPDSVAWHPSRNKLYVAIEAEPQQQEDEESGSNPNPEFGVNAPGEFAIVTVQRKEGGDVEATVKALSFLDYFQAMEPGKYAELLAQGLRIDPRLAGGQSDAGKDVEPEYITIDTRRAKAYVSLQENNAIAQIDLRREVIEKVLPMGLKDWSAVTLDPSDKDGAINMRSFANLRSWYSPDSLAHAWIPSGKKQKLTPYIFTANEGDTKEEYMRVKDMSLDPAAFPAELDVQADGNLGRLSADSLFGFPDSCPFNKEQPWDGQTCERTEIIFTGGRSFSIMNARNGKLVYDSGDEIEKFIAVAAPEIFNTDNDENTFKTRSDAKGPEPEAIEVFKMGARTYAAVGLERQGGVIVYDVTKPRHAKLLGYLNDRTDLTLGATTETLAPQGITLGPEKLLFTRTGSDGILWLGAETSGHLVAHRVKPCSAVSTSIEA